MLTVMFGLTIIVLMGFTGLSIDVGYLQWERRRIQAAADAAAMGGLRELELNQTDLVAAGRYDSQLNGFQDGVNNTSVTINTPPTTGSYAGDVLAVESIVNRTVPTFFMSVFGQRSVTISAHAVAKTSTSIPSNNAQGSIGGCIFALNPSIKSAINVNGTSMNLNLGCSIVDESSNSSAYTMGSGVTLNIGNKAKVGVVGSYAINGQASIVDTTTGNTELPQSGITSPGDPFVNIPEPVITGLTQQTATGVTYSKTNMPPGATLSPGIYCGGIVVGDTNGVYITLNPGLYVMGGGGLQLNSSALLQGTGVTFYSTSSTRAGCAAGGGLAAVSFDGQSISKLVAPTSGLQEGFLFFEDRTIAIGTNIVNKVVGGSGSSFDGALYFKNHSLTFAGTNATHGYMVLVADTISINGSTSVGNNYSSLRPGSHFPMAPLATGGGLVE
jgi:hypothetical protein